MALTVAWAVPDKTILSVVFRGVWTLSDFKAAVEQCALMMESVAHTVHIVADFSESQLISTALLSGIRTATEYQQPNLGAIVVLRASSNVQVMIRTALVLQPALKPYIYFTHKPDMVHNIMNHHARRQLPA